MNTPPLSKRIEEALAGADTYVGNETSAAADQAVLLADRIAGLVDRGAYGDPRVLRMLQQANDALEAALETIGNR